MTDLADMPAALVIYRRIADAFTARVDGVSGDGWSAPSPCAGWTARDVVVHVIDAHRRLVDGDRARPVGPDEDVATTWHQAYDAAKDLLAQPGALEAVRPGPFGPMPTEQLLTRLITTDILVHTWDLARATGQDERLDPEAVERAYSGLKPMDAMIRMPGVFGPKVTPPEGADLQTEFLCFLGRQV